ncbi:uncharacterized protein C2845_PM06G04280 [Panicum miliaceum]|uniref:Uncharacterized protein n=1 Tax=Panicum miliaceum TaxID=4540 RepID=A0A3L6R8F8_PANMI|nr:uncharacterized protein C2845_PM06G04280 [Panicum miliaceum]
MATPWVMLGRYLRVGLVPGDVEAEEAQAEQAAAGLDAEAQAVALEEQVAATMDAVDAEAQAGLVAPVNAGEEAQAEDVDGKAEHAAAAADFRLSVALPPRVTVIAAGRGAHPDPESPDICPYVVAVSPQFLLVHFTGPFFFGTHFTHHLVLVRDLHHGQTTY